MNNSFATISADGQWFVSGEWLQMQRLLVFAMPQRNPSAPRAGRPGDHRALTSLGELPMQSLCSGTFAVEGIDVSGSQLLVEVTPPSPCRIAATTVYRYALG